MGSEPLQRQTLSVGAVGICYAGSRLAFLRACALGKIVSHH